MDRPPLVIPPNIIARTDQLAAELRNLVDQAAEHAADCRVTDGECVGGDVVQAILALDNTKRALLLAQAVKQLARERP